VYDGSDLLLGLKTPIFLGIVFVFGVSINLERSYKIPLNLGLYFLVFSVLLPTVSIIISRSGGEPSDGMQYLKGYLFLFVVFIMYHYQLSILLLLVRLLTLLAVVILVFYVISLLPSFESFEDTLYVFGNEYKIFTIHSRTYGAFEVPSIYFHTSPLLIVPLGYYFNKFLERPKLDNLLLGALILIALILSGTRNNMFMGLLVPVVIYLLKGNRRNVLVVIILISLCILIFLFSYGHILLGFFSATEPSNAIKLAYLTDYAERFTNISTWLWGEGLGSFFYSTPHAEMVSVTELTYFELFRRYGLIMGFIYFLLMLYPCLRITSRSEYAWLYLVYVCFLVMVFFNPFYYSSTGILFLSEVLYRRAEETKQL